MTFTETQIAGLVGGEAIFLSSSSPSPTKCLPPPHLIKQSSLLFRGCEQMFRVGVGAGEGCSDRPPAARAPRRQPPALGDTMSSSPSL